MELKKFEMNVVSQWGEDGVIQEIFKRIGTTNKFCVEFGAWDGKYLSNVWNLWHNQDWSAVLIESEKKRIDQVAKEYKQFTKVTPIAAFVEPSGKNSLDNILDRSTKEKVPDLICIDIDSDDYYVFESLKKHLPRVLIIEYNPSIPPHIELVQAKGEYFGASARAMLNLAHSKGYKLAHITKTNLFFVENREFKKLKIKELELNLETFPEDTVNYLISAYDGTPMLWGTPPYTYLATLGEAADDPSYQSKSPKIVQKSAGKLTPVKIFKK